MAEWGPTAVAADADDVWESGGAIATGTLYMGNESGASHNIGLRFTSVAVPAGSTINNATLTLQGRNLFGTVTNIHGTIYGDDVDDASAWAGSGTLASQITETTATADMDPTAWVNGVDYSYTITGIVAEIVARGGWASGQAMRFAILNDGSSTDCFLRAMDTADEVGIARLYIDYTEAATAQFARPAADRTDGSWLNEASSNTDLFESINEETYSDSDYIRSGASPNEDTCTIDLSSIDTPGAGTVTMRIRARFI